jgi:hypothetical protein
MAEPTPAEDTPVSPDETESGRAKHVAPIDEEQPDHPAVARAATGPDAAGGTETVADRTDEPVAASPAAPAVAATPVARTEEPVATTAAETRAEPVTALADEDRTAVLPERQDTVPAADTRANAATTDPDRTAVLAAGAASVDRTPPPPAPTRAAVPVPPAYAPPPPRKGGNRLVGTAWVLLAALVFEVLYLAAFALVVLVVAGSASVALSVQQLIGTPFAWLPVLLFALFYELTVLLLNRAGRFAYVLSSLIVALIVYLLSTVLILAMQAGGLSNESNLGRALIAPQVVLIPIIAREVMLWTGLAIGARGRRLRKRNRAAQEQYERETFARSVQDDGAGTPA